MQEESIMITAFSIPNPMSTYVKKYHCIEFPCGLLDSHKAVDIIPGELALVFILLEHVKHFVFLCAVVVPYLIKVV